MSKCLLPAAIAALMLTAPVCAHAEDPSAPPARPNAEANAEANADQISDQARPEVKLGPETNFPLPRYVSMRAEEGYARRGPGVSYRIDWIFQQRHIPLRVTAEYQHWRRVEDQDGQGGWMHYALLSSARYVVMQSETTLRSRAGEDSEPTAIFENGVIARVLSCTQEWCRLRADGHRGWAPKSAFWGVDSEETID